MLKRKTKVIVIFVVIFIVVIIIGSIYLFTYKKVAETDVLALEMAKNVNENLNTPEFAYSVKDNGIEIVVNVYGYSFPVKKVYKYVLSNNVCTKILTEFTYESALDAIYSVLIEDMFIGNKELNGNVVYGEFIMKNDFIGLSKLELLQEIEQYYGNSRVKIEYYD